MDKAVLDNAIMKIDDFRDKLCEILVEETMSSDNCGLDMAKSVIGTFQTCKTPEEFEIADRMLAAICGWRFETLVEKITERDSKGYMWESV